jgi:hypothetical protein
MSRSSKKKEDTHQRGARPSGKKSKLLEARFIRPVDYPSWLANPVLVENPDGS